MRANDRKSNQLRPISITRHYTKHAEGSVLVKYGDTEVICTASFSKGVPSFLKGKDQGWLTAEYGMLPRATHQRTDREATRGKQTGRTFEIQRLIGRSLRTAIDLTKIGENTIHIDCDVIQADGGTRTASITGACVALFDAVQTLQEKGILKRNPLGHLVASVSVGIVENAPMIDLDYLEDSNADTDMNIIMNEENHFIEVQGTAEKKTFKLDELNAMLELAQNGIQEIIAIQREVLGI